jgi:hypothetical protein
MSNHYLAETETVKPLVISIPNRLASFCATLFTTKGADTTCTDDRVSAALSLQQMANDMDSLQPSLAAELRAFASRS